MRSFFFRYVIQDSNQPRVGGAVRVVVIVDQQEAKARQRLLLMNPGAFVLKVEQTPFDVDCRPSCHPSRQIG